MAEQEQPTNRVDWDEALTRAERGEILSLEELSANCSSRAERKALEDKYPFLLRIARAAVIREGERARDHTLPKSFVMKSVGLSLAVALLASVGAICYLAVVGKTVPNILVSVTSALIGYLAGIVTGIVGQPKINASFQSIGDGEVTPNQIAAPD